MLLPTIGAKIENKSRHDWVTIRYNGQFVASYGIRRANSEKNHNHIYKQLHISLGTAKSLAKCRVSKDEYFTSLCEQGKIPQEEGEGGTEEEN